MSCVTDSDSVLVCLCERKSVDRDTTKPKLVIRNESEGPSTTTEGKGRNIQELAKELADLTDVVGSRIFTAACILA